MKYLKFIFFVLAVTILSGCSSLRTAFDYDKEADFTKYKTFAFYKEGMDQLNLNDIDKKRFIKAITNEMQKMGMVKSTTTPDLLVNVIVKGKERTSITDNYYGYGWWYSMPSITVRQYTENTIYIDLVDRAKNQLVWQGKGVGEFLEKEKDRGARIEEAVSMILAQYPYGKK